MRVIRVLLVDDHDVVRQGLRLLLGAEADMLVVGEAENGRRSVEEAKRLRPDVVLMDAAMPQLNGVEATWQITLVLPSVRVLILSSFSDEHFVEQAIEAGAAGYVMKEAAASEVCHAIREVHNGRAFFSPLVSRCLIGLWRERELRHETKSSSRLTSRQMEVLQLIAEGYASKQIASLLSLALKTVEKHRQTLMNKVDCRNIATLTRYAVANGIVTVNNTPHHTPNWPEEGSSFGKWLCEDTAQAV
jgi:DNA-binding NarL/FixJ family response regulator